MKRFRVDVFGKPGCDKCAVLNQRIDTLLSGDGYEAFEKRYHDLETEEGLVHFASAECINPQQIPAMLIMERDGAAERYAPVPNPRPGIPDETCGNARLYQYVGLRTDYTGAGKGVLTPKMIQTVLDEVRGV